MKLFTIISFIGYSIAQTETDATEKKFSAIVEFAYSQVTTADDVGTWHKKIQNYGCHCFPDATRVPGGKGAPVDDMDNLCRDLARCHACVELDHGVSNIGLEKYKYVVTGSTIDCSSNTEAVKLQQCECDKQFAIALGGVWDDASFNTFYWGNKNNNDPQFDIVSTCTAGSGAGVQDACCGASPDRRPYSSAVFECCSDGSIASVGGC